MECTVYLRGVPLARVSSFDPSAELAAVILEPLPAYAAVRTLVRAATSVLASLGVLGAAATREPLACDRDAVRTVAALGRQLELRSATGTVVPTDFIDIADAPGTYPSLFAWIRRRESKATIPAIIPPARLARAEEERPEV